MTFNAHYLKKSALIKRQNNENYWKRHKRYFWCLFVSVSVCESVNFTQFVKRLKWVFKAT